MSLAQLAVLVRRHVLAVSLVLLVTAGIAMDFHIQSIYKETAIVELEPESFVSAKPLGTDESFLQNSSLITTCELLVMHLSGSQGESQLHRAGVTDNFTVSLVNASNADSPIYAYPDLSVSLTGENPDRTHRQSIEAMNVLSTDIANFQAGNQFSARDRIVPYTLSDSGPISQRGSTIRAYCALIFLSLVAIFWLCCWLDRRSRATVAPTVGYRSLIGEVTLGKLWPQSLRAH